MLTYLDNELDSENINIKVLDNDNNEVMRFIFLHSKPGIQYHLGLHKYIYFVSPKFSVSKWAGLYDRFTNKPLHFYFIALKVYACTQRMTVLYKTFSSLMVFHRARF